MKLLSRYLWSLCAVILLCGIRDTGAQSILFHGANADASAGADAAVFAHLQTLFGPANVTYMQSDLAAADGSSANGFDALVISSTVQSASVRNKYEDSPVGIVNWEAAIMDDGGGELQLSDAGDSTLTGTQIDIVDPSHPLAAGLVGTVAVLSSTQNMVLGVAPLGEGVVRIANATTDPTRPAIIAADVGATLRGDGTAEFPMTAAGRRVNFFLHDASFPALTAEGRTLFETAVNWAANIVGPPPVPGDTNGNMIGGEFPDDFEPIRANFRMMVDSREEGDLVRNGVVDFDDFHQWKAAFLGAGGSLAGVDIGFLTSVPEPSAALLMLIGGAALVCYRASRERGAGSKAVE